MDYSCSFSKSFMNLFTSNPKLQFNKYSSEIESSVLRILRSGKYIFGEELEKFEQAFKKYIGSKFAIGVANGTDAIEIALRALNIRPGDEVITVSHTAVATVAAILATGAKPVLIDIENDFYTMDYKNIANHITTKTKAIIAVHLYGQPCEINKIQELCISKKIKLIEDVSQAHGSTFYGKKLGLFGDIACFSCYPTKNLGALGDAGVIVTNSEENAEKCKKIRQYGWGREISSEIFGRNSRLDEIQAGILNIKLKYLDENNKIRNELAKTYSLGLRDLPLKTPLTRKNCYHVFHLYVIKTDQRDKLVKFLNSHNIFPGIHYPFPIHQQKTYSKRAIFNSLKITEETSKKILSLPIYPELRTKDIRNIIEKINSFFNQH